MRRLTRAIAQSLAAAMLTACASEPEPLDPDAADLGKRAAEAMAAKDPEKALEHANQALEIDERALFPRIVRVGALCQLKRCADAEPDCELILTETKLPWFTYLFCAEPPRLAGDDRTALERLHQGTGEYPDNATLLGMEAETDDKLGHFDWAASLMDRALAIEPDNARFLNGRAWQKIGTGDFAAALEDANHSLKIQPDTAAVLDTRCFALAGLSRFEEALRDCKRALALMGGNAPTSAGMIAFIEGRNDEALAAWSKYADDPVASRQLAPWIAKAKAR